MKKEKIEKYMWSIKKPMYIEKNDKRYKEHVKQLKKYGFSDTETWNLFGVIAEFVLPRLKRFKKVSNGYPGGEITEAKWNEILDKMIFAFEWSITYDNEDNSALSEKREKANWKRYEEGMELFAKWFMALWW
jgi:hypothetical protein